MRARLVLLLAIAAVFLPAAASASTSSLYHGPHPRPGPAILYRKPATALQFVNKGPWHAKPILISGSSAYRNGEFLYQDFIYDDDGARGTLPDLGDPRSSTNTFSGENGTYTYPTNPAYVGNLADLVEFRVKPLANATAFRLTLNSMTDPSLVAATIAIGDSKTPQAMPFGANTSAPAKLFLTVHGKRAALQDAANGKRVGPAAKVRILRNHRQIQIEVPHSAWNPGTKTVRFAAGVGLWDKANDSYLIPGGSATASQPGGATGLSNASAFFNVAFRYDEPWPDVGSGAGAESNPAWWRDKAQAAALASGDISRFHADVNFGKLVRGVDDSGRGKPWGVPRSGPMDRILASHFETEQGTDYSTTCGNATECHGELRGNLQPYAIYIPKGPTPKRGYGLTLLLHSLSANYNQFGDTRNQSEFGERGTGSIVITPSGRGPDGWYYGQAGADTFEVWADVAHRYHLNPRYSAIAGYSMGGYGTYKWATQFPDLFARAQPTVGPPALGIWIPPTTPTGGVASNTNRMLASVRNVPFLIWDGTNDELVPVPGPLAQAQTFSDLGYRYEFDLFAPPVDHFLLAVNDQYAPAAQFLGNAKVDLNPPHVTYVVNPTMDFKNDGIVADHAYWLSGLRLRDASGDAPLGKIDAFSEGFGRGDPPHNPVHNSLGSLRGGNVGTLAYDARSRTWGKAPKTPRRDVLRIDATNIRTVKVDRTRAHVDCTVQVKAQSDGPMTIRIPGCDRTIHVP